ncbi:hypothetical protein N7495_001115 [Penicillium taxi]|uniref:uncharacterized protein n=1 Tax=Penicillium taxi TaxID=168475 RepID=UPI0025456BA2|nr:uncharacterized protein N7495_001115 [Penicillium taxi]KAJ5908433.1 hypothetical protein N7495_001115 [Penicillium taxi]
MVGGNVEKGQRYIASLDQARAQGNWEEVPELIRKVTKHAPQRTCLIQTATAESRVVEYLQKKSNAESSSPPDLSGLIPTLLTTIETNDGTPQEILQTQVCLGQIHWTLNEPGLAAGRLPKNFTSTVEALLSTEHQGLSAWTEVCLMKGCYIKACAQATGTTIGETLETFASLAAWLESGQLTASSNSQFLSWAEMLLGKGATMASEEARKVSPYSDPRYVEIALRLFRLWSVHPSVKQGLPSPKVAYADESDQPSRTSIWKTYYAFLTLVLQDGLLYVPPLDGPERPQFASELRRIEGICEGNLLREAKFPAAHSDNFPVEKWVEQVIGNWEVLCGPRWQDQDLGEGGQISVGRNVLDILYRAATKTYHSPLILRRLFHVHSSLADFDLAVQALNSYVEIVVSAKDRAESGAEYGELEKDEILLKTLAEGITLLACLGSLEEAEKAKELTELLKKYIDKQFNALADDQVVLSQDASPAASPIIPPDVLAAAYRAVGVGLANWASYTPLNEARDEIRVEAIEYLEKSLVPELSNELSYASLYTLSLTLAENRDLDTAINYIKSALTSHQSSGVSEDLPIERDLVPCWHLLALLLSAKQEFDIAERSCEAAFEQFPPELFSKNSREKRLSRHGPTGTKRPLVGQLQGREKERIVETRITQLAFVEVLEGPEAAVNQSGQLLSLFASLFQDLNLDPETGNASQSEHLVPPKSSAGTVKTFRGGIFNRHRLSQLPDRRADRFTSAQPSIPPVPTINDGVNGTDAPAIQVTDEDHPQSSSIVRSDSKRSRKRSSTFFRNEKPKGPEPPLPTEGAPPETVGIAISGNSAPMCIEHAAHSKEAPRPSSQKEQLAPSGYENQIPQQDEPASVYHRFNSPTNANIKVPLIQSKKHALALLVKIWIVIAGLYRRASLFDDAREACEEAWKQAARVEALSASEESSARSLSKRSWTSAKSSEELWADVFAEQGLLSQAQSRPHEAIRHFEDALLRHSEHPTATIGLSNLLLDIWDQTMPAEPKNADVELSTSRASLLSETPKLRSVKAVSTEEMKIPDVAETLLPVEASVSPHDVDPKHLHRLAARDRAYALLSALTKLGSSWDNSEGWYALSRAYEAGEQVEKLKEVLWWCIELEDSRPIRNWSNIGSGLYVL